MSGHIIHKQTFNLSIDSEDQAHQISESVKNTWYDKVLPSLDQLFFELSPENQIYRFNRVEIDLGFIADENLETELTARVTDRVKQAVREQIEAFSFSPPETRTMEILPLSTSIFEAFIFYLEFGILPWWLSDKGNKKPEEIFREIPEDILPGQLAELRRIFKLKKARIRFTRQFPDDFVSRLLKAGLPKLKDEKPGSAKNFPAAFSAEIANLLTALNKIQITSEIRENLKAEIIEQLSAKIHGLDALPAEQDSQKTVKLGNEFAERVIYLLIFSFTDRGYSPEEIVKIFRKLEKLLPDKSWLKNRMGKLSLDEKRVKKATGKKREFAGEELSKDDQTETSEEDKQPFADQSGVYIRNAGAVLLWPFLKNYFTALGLLAGDRFKSSEDQQKAALLLQHAITGDAEFAEYQLPLNKILCGLPVDEPLISGVKISAKEKTETETLIQSAIETWKAIGKVSVEGFRESFLQREGRLKKTDNGWNLKVERKTIDILLDKLPWMISMVKIKWMKQMIYVDW